MATVQYDTTDLNPQRFNLKECEYKLSQYCSIKDIDGIAYDNYFIAPKTVTEKQELFVVDHETCFRVNKANFKFAKCTLLEKHDLVMGNYVEKLEIINTSTDYRHYLHEFKNIIIDVKLFWTVEFLNIISHYLKNRRSASSMLIHKEVIQTMLGDAIVHIKAAEQYRHFAKDISLESIAEYQLFSMKELRSAAHLLAKLHGGRSFLSGNVIEMMMIFEYFRNIYFS